MDFDSNNDYAEDKRAPKERVDSLKFCKSFESLKTLGNEMAFKTPAPQFYHKKYEPVYESKRILTEISQNPSPQAGLRLSVNCSLGEDSKMKSYKSLSKDLYLAQESQ